MNEFDDLSELDDVFGLLRSAARSAELSQENATVDLMVKAHRTSEGKHMFTSRRARIATLVATGVLGFGGMAAASPSLGGDDPVQQDPAGAKEQVVPEPAAEPVEVPVVEVPAAEPVEVPVVEVPAAEPVEVAVVEVPAEVVPAEDDEDTDFDETTCRPGNHGKTVSAVARGEFPGVSVTDAAHSSCGKAGEVEEPEAVEPEPEGPEVEGPEIDEDSEAKADRPDKSDKGAEKAANRNGNGNSNGNGNGNGNRNRDD